MKTKKNHAKLKQLTKLQQGIENINIDIQNNQKKPIMPSSSGRAFTIKIGKRHKEGGVPVGTVYYFETRVYSKKNNQDKIHHCKLASSALQVLYSPL